MDRLPKIGEPVRFVGNSVVGACLGVIKRIYPSHVPAPGEDEENDNCRYVQGPFDPETWAVLFEVEGKLPEPFVYPNTKLFAPRIIDIEPREKI